MDKRELLRIDESTDRFLRRQRRDQIVQNVRLIWLDNNIDTNESDYYNMITQLRSVINSIKTFNNREECMDFLTNISNGNIIMIISQRLYQTIVPEIHDLTQVHTIFIFGENKMQDDSWAEKWPKVKGVFTQISSICDALKQVTQQCAQNDTPISFLDTNDNALGKNFDQLDPPFMYTQILKEILLTLQFDQQHIAEFIKYLYEQFDGNDHALQKIKTFEEKYHDETSIRWYTRESFLYPMLNGALREMDADLIIKMGFFIRDLHHHIEKLHSEQFGDDSSRNTFTLYRGQGMKKEAFEKMAKLKGGLIAFNNFLSTTVNENVARLFAESNTNRPDLIGIQFVMTVDASHATTPFAFINHVSHFKDEDEVLFAMNAVFRIRDIKSIDENNRLFRVDLTLSTDDDKDLRILTDHLRQEVSTNIEGWGRLGSLLLSMGQFDRAQEVYEIQLKQTTIETQRARLYNDLGWVKRQQGKYQEAITFLTNSREIYEKTSPPTDPDAAWPYHNLGQTYHNIGKDAEALSFYEKALEIRRLSLPSNHSSIAASYNNIGKIYSSKRKYSEALWYYGKTLEIQQQSLPRNDPSLASSFNSIGLVYKNMGKYSKALSYFQEELEIQLKSLPAIHPDVARSFDNIGVVYEKMGEYSKALGYHQEALEIRQKRLPPNHVSLAMSNYNIGIVYDKMSDYSKAQPFYERAVQIGEQALPADHYNIRRWRKTLENLREKL